MDLEDSFKMFDVAGLDADVVSLAGLEPSIHGMAVDLIYDFEQRILFFFPFPFCFRH